MSESFKTVFIGEGTLLAQCAEALLGAGHSIVAVVSTDRTIAQWASTRGLHRCDSIEELPALASDHRIDYLFSVANLSMIPARILALASRGGINFHDGPLPRYAGLHATSWALLNGERTHGVTWHEMGERADTGRILAQRTFDVPPGETAFTLNARCYEAGLDAFRELVGHLTMGALAPRAQDAGHRTYFGRRRRPSGAGLIAVDRSAAEIDALVRALSFGPYPNPLALPKLQLPRGVVTVGASRVTPDASSAAPGTVVSSGSDELRLSTTTVDIELTQCATLEGLPLTAGKLAALGGTPGARLPVLDADLVSRATALHEAVCAHEGFWAERLATLEPTALPIPASGDSSHERPVALPPAVRASLQSQGVEPRLFLLGAWAAYFAILGGHDQVDLGFTTTALAQDVTGLDTLFASSVPFRLAVDRTSSGRDLSARAALAMQDVERRRTFVRDLPARLPHLAASAALKQPLHFPLAVRWVESTDSLPPLEGTQLELAVGPDAAACVARSRAPVGGPQALDALVDGFLTFAEALAGRPDAALDSLPLVSPATAHAIVHDWNGTASSTNAVASTVHGGFEAQVERTPDHLAVVCRGQALTYRELNRRANQVAHYLRGRGVGTESLVGLCLERSTTMMVGLLGVLKAGAAYVPLDPRYPTDRLAVMVEDSKATVLLTEQALRRTLPTTAADVVELDAQWHEIGRAADTNPASGASGDNLAYVIFTSGSTGRPKGVMVQHDNVLNFFAGMDAHLGDHGGTWLAVTSISFDISVQELFWPLVHGYTVVIYTGEDRASAPPVPRQTSARPLDFSLFYFASDAGKEGREKYKLLLEGARFADQHGFAAVWTPERHFHAFGGLYPNPSVTSAALAVLTSRVKIRAGSVVLPLHHPLRVAEEWSLVDNLSSGRAGIAFAAGWQSNDFVLRPENYAERKAIMMRDIDVVRRLWRGESVAFPDASGKMIDTHILPRPVQRELPFWLTVAGNPETFRMAGECGAFLLTHLLGQTFEEVGRKIQIYRDAWKAAGHPGDGYVTLMLHTFVGDDTDAVREIVRQPFSDYLRTAVDLVKHAPEQFPTHKPATAAQAAAMAKGMQQATEEDVEALLEFAFERYFETSGLLGSVDRCLEIVDHVRTLGTDEIGCLVDYGVHPALVLPSLRHLDTVRERSQAQATPATADESIAGLIARYQVSHLQCTPSMGRMLVSDAESRKALASLRTLLLGGEALPPDLADQVATHVPGEILNMYGPTETTIWSSTSRVTGRGAPVTIGRPLANQQIFVMSPGGQVLPPGVAGELWIGGDGVVRGYLDRPELTAERFVTATVDGSPRRLYRTGDLARFRADGSVEFLGRLDHQVKIRGFRVELGEIESTLLQHPQVSQAVVVSREDTPGDQRLVGYIVAKPGTTAPASELKTLLQGRLPDFMVPSAFVTLDALPLTPNGKVNRRALPAPERTRQEAAIYVPPENELERVIATVFAEALGIDHVGAHDNFFDLGAHSLLMVQVHARLQEALDRRLSLIQLFRFPTVSSLAGHLSADEADGAEAMQRGSERADRRRESLVRRQQARRQLARP